MRLSIIPVVLAATMATSVSSMPSADATSAPAADFANLFSSDMPVALTGPNNAGPAHACDICKDAYWKCMNHYCWIDKRYPQRGWAYCNKMCECKAYHAGNICIGCQWRCR